MLALRGDRNPDREPAGVFMHASDLTRYIRQTHPEMTVYGACYPECHPQSRDLDEDISWLKVKVELWRQPSDLPAVLRQRRLSEVPGQGARRGHRRADRGRHHAGDQRRIGPAHDRHVLLQVPERLATILDRWGDDPNTLKEAGIIYASEQIADLVARGVDGIHLYTMNHPGVTRRIWQNVQGLYLSGSPRGHGHAGRRCGMYIGDMEARQDLTISVRELIHAGLQDLDQARGRSASWRTGA